MKLTARTGNNLRSSDFVFPKERRYPIEDLAHARNALARVAQSGSSSEQEKVRAAVFRRYPELKRHEEERAHASDRSSKAMTKMRQSAFKRMMMPAN